MKHERQNSVVHLMDCIEGMKSFSDIKWKDATKRERKKTIIQAYHKFRLH